MSFKKVQEAWKYNNESISSPGCANLYIRKLAIEGNLDELKRIYDPQECNPCWSEHHAIYEASFVGNLDVVKYLYDICNCEGKKEFNILVPDYESMYQCWRDNNGSHDMKINVIEQTVYNALTNGHQDIVDYFIGLGYVISERVTSIIT